MKLVQPPEAERADTSAPSAAGIVQGGAGTGDVGLASGRRVVPADPEVVIRQARARQRRRRRRIVVVVAAALVGAGFLLAADWPVGVKTLGAPGAAGPAASSPVVDAASFAGRGELAFVSQGALWVLDGRSGTLRRVRTPGVTPAGPVFSRDGRWLAFVGTAVGRSAGNAVSTLWLAPGNGSGAHRVRGLAPDRLVGWSPAADVLAVTAGPVSAGAPYGLPTTVGLVWPSGSTRRVVRAAAIESAVWSPGGDSVAVAIAGASASELASFPVSGGRPVVWLRRATSGPGGLNYLIDPAGWWSHRGIGFWALANSASLSADRAPFYVISAPGAPPRRLGYTLPGQTTGAVEGAGSGWLALADEPPGASGGREIWQGTRVEACAPATAVCTAIWASRPAVTLDPAWSPGSATLAFVRAPSRSSPGFGQRVTASWYGAHQLWLYDPAKRWMRRLDAPGASAPVWSADGNSLLYAARDGIWLLPRLDKRPVQVAHPLFRPGSWPAYYGQVGWAAQFAWWSH